MKKPVLALLLAGADAMRGMKGDGMDQDRMAPGPMFRGDDARMNAALEARSCLDAAGDVAAKLAAVAAAKTLIAGKVTAQGTLAGLVDTAVAAKKTAVAAVVAKDEAMKALVTTDRAADAALLAAQDDRDTKLAAKTAADAALAAKQAELTAQTALLAKATAKASLAKDAKDGADTEHAKAVTAEATAKTKAETTTANEKTTKETAYTDALKPLEAKSPALDALADEAAFTAKKGGGSPGETANYANYAAYERARLGQRAYTAAKLALLDTAKADEALMKVQKDGTQDKPTQIQTAATAVTTTSGQKDTAVTNLSTVNPDSDFTNAWTPLQTKIQLAKSTYATYLGELSKVYYTAGDWTTELTTDGHLWADLGGGTKKCDPATATAGTPANQANAAACKAACLTAGFHAVYVPAQTATIKAAKATGSDAVNTLAAAKTVAEGKVGACVGVDWVQGSTSCTIMTFKNAAVFAAHGADAGACYQAKQYALAVTAHTAFHTYKTAADAIAALATTFLAKTGGSSYTTWQTSMKAAQRDKSLYAKLKAVSDLRKQAWLDKVTAATASITSPNGAAYKAWADENTTLTGLESTLATALTNKNTAVTAFTTAATEYTAAQALTAAWLAAKGTAATVKTRADGVATTLTAAVGTLTTAVGDAASGLTKAKTTAGTEYTAADTALTAAKTAATASEAALTTPLSERATALAAVTTAEAAVAAEWAKITTNTQELDAGIADLATKEAALLAAEVACKAAQYDAFKTALTTAEAERTAKLATIKNLVESAPVYALGATNGRCEKPMTNGDWAKRGKCANAEADCCGAARGVGPSGATMTIEVCQPKASQAYMWQPPRAPMATTWPAKVSWDFVCIGGATQLAGAAAALLASAYMMA